MNDQTEILKKTDETAIIKRPVDESIIFSVSVRAWIAVVLVLTVCFMSITGRVIMEPLYTLVGLVVGCLFGNATKPKSQTQ